MSDSKDFDEEITSKFLKECLDHLVVLTQFSNTFPEREELGFYKRIPSCNQNIKNINNLLVSAMKEISDFCMESNQIDPSKTIRFKDSVDILDACLENVDLTLDKLKNNTQNESNLFVKENSASKQYNERREDKPQYKFKDGVDNSEEYPFIPKITKKVNSDIPLDEKLHLAQFNKSEFFENIQNPPAYEFRHPYEEELNQLEYQDFQFELAIQSQKPQNFKSNNFVYIDTVEAFREALEEIKSKETKEIAFDLEHHSYRSYQGFTCLMQLSTREKDYMIDTLCLREYLQEMNTIFTDPKIVKVFHGADMDIQWLQKDFGIYVVNMFDTGQASRFLSLPALSLAYLLKEFCGVIANKEYQTADWRQRPLPRDMIKYAREDTHYLLYIYDEIRKKIIQKAEENNLNPIESLKSVLNKSKLICLRTYKKPILKNENYTNIMSRNKAILSFTKYKILKAIFKWRDQVARLEDENPGFVLPMNVMFEVMELKPKSPQEFYAKIKKIHAVTKKHVPKLIEDIHHAEEKIKSKRKLEESKFLGTTFAHQVQPNLTKSFFQGNILESNLSENEKFKMGVENVQIVSKNLTVNSQNINTHNYHKILSTNQDNSAARQAFSNIKKSFSYSSVYDFMMDAKQNFRTEILTNQIEFERKAKERSALDQQKDKALLNQANLTNEGGYIEFTKEKGQSTQKAAPTLSLGLETNINESQKLPLSLKEKHNVKLSKKQGNKTNPTEPTQKKNDGKVNKQKRTFDEFMKDSKIENKYNNLAESSDEEIPEITNLSKIQKKTFQKFWEKNSQLKIDDPLQSVNGEGKDPQRNNRKRKGNNYRKVKPRQKM